MPMPEKYTKAWVCNLYKISSKTLSKWLNNEKFAPKLLDTGYNKNQKLFTPEQFRLFEEHFGKP